MIAELKTMADGASPTAFHRFLKALDDEGKLFRVYTQCAPVLPFLLRALLLLQVATPGTLTASRRRRVCRTASGTAPRQSHPLALARSYLPSLPQ